jgi:hypothetical protein
MVRHKKNKSKKKVAEIKQNVSEKTFSKDNVFKKFPGFYAAIIFTIIVFVAYGLMIFDLTANTRSEDATYLSEEIKFLMDYYIEDIDYSLNQEGNDDLEKIYLISMRDEFEWIKIKEKEAYNAFPLSDAEHREVALYFFVESILNLNEIVSFELGSPDYDSEINRALLDQNELPDIISEALEEFDLDDSEKNKIVNHFNKLLEEYIQEKIVLIKTIQSAERKYVEARKVNYIQYAGYN